MANGDLYTVVVLYPSTMQQRERGDMTYTAHVRAASWEGAMLAAVSEAVLHQTGLDRKIEGWRPLVAFRGWHDTAGFGWQARDRHIKEG